MRKVKKASRQTKHASAGMGAVHCGLWEGLQQPDPWSPGASVLDSLIQVPSPAGVVLQGYMQCSAA